MSSDSAQAVEPLVAAPIRRPRWPIAAFIAVLIAAAVGWMYLRITERSRVLAAIEAAGGRYQAPNNPPYIERLLAVLFGAGDRTRHYSVLLTGSEFDDAWLTEHRHLSAVPIDELMIVDTQLTRASVLRLLRMNRLTSLNAARIPLTDADAELLGGQDRLTHLNLMQSEITDAGFAALRPQRLTGITVAGTRVTPAALQSGLTGPLLQFVGLDGRQFTPELAAQLAGRKTVNMISLIGPEVTDAHVKLLESMPNLVWIGLDQTSASEAAIASLKAAKPKATIDVFDAESTLFK